MKARHEQEMKDLGDVIYAMQLRYSDREADATSNFQSLMDELKNKVNLWVLWWNILYKKLLDDDLI